MKRFMFVLTLLLSSYLAYPDTPENPLLPKVLEQLNLEGSEINFDLYVEKVLPYATGHTVMVIPRYRDHEVDEYGNGFSELDAYIVVIDNTSGQILQHYYEPKAWTSDAIMLADIVIDTGIYTIGNKVRAFGIRVNYTGSSRPNPYSQTDLSLFIPEGKTLKRILKNYPVASFRGEWDTNCEGTFESVRSVISIDEKNRSNGFHTLIIKDEITSSKNVLENGDCIEKASTQYTTKKLKYNGTEYQ